MKNNFRKFIISRTDSIGDVVLTLPVAGILKSCFPDCTIIFLGRDYTKPVAEACECIDEVISWDEIATLKGKEGVRFIQSLNADSIIHVFPRKEIAAYAKQAGIPLRVGTSHRLYHWFTCNRLLNFTRNNSNLHESQLNLKLLEPFGINREYSLPELQNYSFFKKIKPLNPDLKLLFNDNRFKLILHPKSKGSAREWGVSKYKELIALLPKDKVQIFVTGTAQEGESFKELLGYDKHTIDMTGKLSLVELISFINNCDGLVAASTGPLHLAAVMGKKAIGLYSPVRPIHPGRWAPIGPNAKFLVASESCGNCTRKIGCNCLSSIKAQDVADTILRELK